MSKQNLPVDELVEIDLHGYLEATWLEPTDYEEEKFDTDGKKVE